MFRFMSGIFLYFPRGEMKSPPSRTFYLTDSVPWATSSLPRGANTHGSAPAFHGYQDSVASSGRGSMLDAREAGEQYGSSARGLDDSSYGTLEERHNKRSGSKDSLLDQNYGKYITLYCHSGLHLGRVDNLPLFSNHRCNPAVIVWSVWDNLF